MTGPGARGLPWWRRWRTGLLGALLAVLAIHVADEAFDAARAYEQAEREALTRHVELAQALADAVELFVGQYASLAESAVGPLLETGLDRGRRQAQLERLARLRPDTGAVAVTDAGGRVVQSSASRWLGLDLSGRDYYRRLRAGDHVVVSDLLRGGLSGRWATPVAAAARAPNGRFVGMLVLGLPSQPLADRLRMQLTGGAYPVVLDRARRAVIHGGRPDVGWEARDLSTMPLVRDAAAGRVVSTARAVDPLTGETVVGAAVQVPSLGWVVGVLQPRDAVLAPARREVRDAVLVGLAVLAGGVVLAVLLARWLASPLAALAGGVSALARGDLGHRVPVRWGNEFGLLAARFNDMAERMQRTVAEVTEAQARLTLALEAGRMGAWEFDPATQRVAWSPTLEAIHGLGPGEFPGTFDFVRAEMHPEDRERVLASIAVAMAGGADHDVEYRVRRRDGDVRWLAARGRARRDASGAVIGMSGICMDVTERKRTEEALRTATSLLEAVVEASPLAIMAFDADGRVTLWNPAAERTFGFAAAEALGGEALAVDDATRDDFLRNLRRVLAGEVVSGVESRRRRKDGTTLHVQLWSAPLGGPDGRVAGALSIVADVTEQKRAREGQRLLVEAGAALASSLDLDSTLDTLARLAVPRLADACIIDLLRPDGAIECAAVAHPDRDKADAVREMRRRFPPDPSGPHPAAVAIRTGRTQLLAQVSDADVRSVAASDEHLRIVGTLAATSVAAVPLVARSRVLGALQLVTEGGRSLAASDLAVLEEIAGRAALAIENARLYQEAHAAMRAREAFLARAAHELRTPLTSALGTVRWLKRAQAGSLRESPEELIEIANRNLEAMMALVNDLLDASKLASGREALSMTTVALADVARRAAEVVRAQARAAGVRLDVRVPEALTLPADRLKLEQVFVNLLANAVKFTGAGGEVAIEASLEGAEAAVRVRDTGEGIAREHLEAIFEPFYQVAGARSRRRRGTGLGLAICRQIVSLHGGRISAESEGPGRGSVFTVVIPGAVPGEHAA